MKKADKKSQIFAIFQKIKFMKIKKFQNPVQSTDFYFSTFALFPISWYDFRIPRNLSAIFIPGGNVIHLQCSVRWMGYGEFSSLVLP